MAIEKALIIEKDSSVRFLLEQTLQRKNILPFFAADDMDARAHIDVQQFDLILCSDDIDLLQDVKSKTEHTPVVILTSFARMQKALSFVRRGAFSYLIKPFSTDSLETLLEKIEEHMDIMQENLYLREEVSCKPKDKKYQIIAESSIMKSVLGDVEKIAKSHASVFITGESGTGKEAIAQAIHYQSYRKTCPFIKVNCAAIPEALIESEFFGHEKGAFTGALMRRTGRFELAHRGTLLLDEVSEIPINLQAKLLRAIQEMEFERVGGVKSVQVDVRLIATSNKNLQEAIDNKLFREDLFYRLNVIPIHLSPLRERKEDILPLAYYFLDRFSEENKKPRKTFSKEAESQLLSYAWPGNIRELANVMERTVIMHTHTTITPHDVRLDFLRPPIMTLEDIEKKHILNTLLIYQDDLDKTAEVLGITPPDLRIKLRQHRIARELVS